MSVIVEHPFDEHDNKHSGEVVDAITISTYVETRIIKVPVCPECGHNLPRNFGVGKDGGDGRTLWDYKCSQCSKEIRLPCRYPYVKTNSASLVDEIEVKVDEL